MLQNPVGVDPVDPGVRQAERPDVGFADLDAGQSCHCLPGLADRIRILVDSDYPAAAPRPPREGRQVRAGSAPQIQHHVTRADDQLSDTASLLYAWPKSDAANRVR